VSWTKQKTDLFMDLVLEGYPPTRISEQLKVPVPEVKAHYKRAFFPKEPYAPASIRKSRAGKQLTKLEKEIIRLHHEIGIPVAFTARILARNPGDIVPDYDGKITFDVMKNFSPATDQLIAHHYLYHVSKTPVISDQAYDDAKAEEIEFGGGGGWLKILSESRREAVSYPPHIRSLAFYMLYKKMEAEGKWNWRILPHHWGTEKRDSNND